VFLSSPPPPETNGNRLEGKGELRRVDLLNDKQKCNPSFDNITNIKKVI
jgi:hypothetical protein